MKRIRKSLFRRGSAVSTTNPSASDRPPLKSATSQTSLRKTRSAGDFIEEEDQRGEQIEQKRAPSEAKNEDQQLRYSDKTTESITSSDPPILESSIQSLPTPITPDHPMPQLPKLFIEEPTPEVASPGTLEKKRLGADPEDTHKAVQRSSTKPLINSPGAKVISREQSLVDNSNAPLVKALLTSATQEASDAAAPRDYFSVSKTALNPGMSHRKIWVKRPGASATLVQIKEDDLVDDVRDMILRKYHNSLGKSFDSPDITLSIVMAHGEGSQRVQRVMGPEEEICRALDAQYPNGQTVDDALLIAVPERRTPKPSPRAHNAHNTYYAEDTRPFENGTDYFPQMPAALPSPAALTSVSRDSHQSHAAHPAHERSISILNTGQVPPLPSPGGTRRPHHIRPNPRPAYTRTQTSSPTTIANAAVRNGGRPRLDSTSSETKHHIPTATAAVPTPPVMDAPSVQGSAPTTPRVSSPGPRGNKTKKSATQKRLAARSASPEPKPTPNLNLSIIDTSVPPINVLIVEDNQINMKLLVQFIRRLKVRWQCAVNGREAVAKWRAGGFHLVLMDIQLPIMSGLEATKEIRRLERVNNIGVFSSASSEPPSLDDGHVQLGSEGVEGAAIGDKMEGVDGEGARNGGEEEAKQSEEDQLGEDRKLFKSPVIIVALTASNLQVDRHEA
ncbi:hypothetical protein LTS18_009980, partial [Coniosporium uncinatum]